MLPLQQLHLHSLRGHVDSSWGLVEQSEPQNSSTFGVQSKQKREVVLGPQAGMLPCWHGVLLDWAWKCINLTRQRVSIPGQQTCQRTATVIPGGKTELQLACHAASRLVKGICVLMGMGTVD